MEDTCSNEMAHDPTQVDVGGHDPSERHWANLCCVEGGERTSREGHGRIRKSASSRDSGGWWGLEVRIDILLKNAERKTKKKLTSEKDLDPVRKENNKVEADEEK